MSEFKFNIKTKMLLLSSIIIFISCVNDDTNFENLDDQNKISIKHISSDDLSRNTLSIFKNKINNLNNAIANTHDEISRFEYYESFGFFVDFDNGKLISVSNENLYYTYPIYKKNEEKLENVVFVNTPNGDIKTYLSKYNITPREYKDLTIQQQSELQPEFQKVVEFGPVEYVCIDFIHSIVIYDGCNVTHSNGYTCEDEEVVYETSSICTWFQGESTSGGGGESNTDNNTNEDTSSEQTTGGSISGGVTSDEDNIVTSPVADENWIEVLNCINGPLLEGEEDNTSISDETIELLDFPREHWASINEYLDNNNCSENAQSFAILALEALNNYSEVDFPNEIIYFAGDKPLEEFDNKCDGIERIWQLSQINGDEYAAVLTTDGAVLITQQLDPNGGGISGIYNHNGNTYYQYPTSQGPPSRTYAGQITVSGRYFIPIVSSIHSHTPCLNDGTDGITNNIINDDQAFANYYSNINHYIIGCNAIGQFNGSSNQAFNISNGSLSSICNNVN